MSLEALLGKPVQHPATVVAKPAPEIADGDDELDRMLAAIKRRSHRLAIAGALGSNRMVTEQSIRQGD